MNVTQCISFSVYVLGYGAMNMATASTDRCYVLHNIWLVCMYVVCMQLYIDVYIS
jgi:hypothetical protein